jgi:GH25 family lysozyme M1 (1,4-beta-N-acetylmuramidase)
MSIRGVDISEFQGDVDFGQLQNDVEFVWMRVGEGYWLGDNKFQRNRGESRKTKLIRGFYHLVRPDLGNPVQQSVDAMLSWIDDLQPGEFIVLDYEVNYGDPVNWCLQYLKLIELKTGHKPLIYMNLSTIFGHDWTPVIQNNNGLIVALPDGDANTIPSTPWPVTAMKQWSWNGRVQGIGTEVDIDTFFGDRDALLKYCKQPTETIPPPTPEPEPKPDEFEYIIRFSSSTITEKFDNINGAKNEFQSLISGMLEGETITLVIHNITKNTEVILNSYTKPMDPIPPTHQPDFWKELLGRLTSRKFWLAIVGIITVVINAGGHLSQADISAVLVIVLGYLGIEGGADIAKIFYPSDKK